jgi:hypothetical protein
VTSPERQLVGERGLRKPASHRQLRARADHQLADHRDTQVPLAAALAGQQPLEIEPSEYAQDRGDVPVRQRGLDLKLLLEVNQHPA